MNVFCNSVFMFLLLGPFSYLIILTASGYCARRNKAPGVGVSLHLALFSRNSCTGHLFDANYMNASSSCFKVNCLGTMSKTPLSCLYEKSQLLSPLPFPYCHLTSAASRTLCFVRYRFWAICCLEMLTVALASFRFTVVRFLGSKITTLSVVIRAASKIDWCYLLFLE